MVRPCSRSSWGSCIDDVTDSTTKYETGDHLTPLIVGQVGCDPVPVLGTDDRLHLPYELSVFNAGPRDATLQRITVHADTPDGPVLGELAAEQIVANSILIAAYSAFPEPVGSVPSGRTVVVILDVSVEDHDDVPSSLVHVIEVAYGDTREGQAEFASSFPTSATQVGGHVEVDPHPPVRIRPPLTGPHWLAANAVGPLNPHRGAIISVGGRMNPAERYAIDWVRIDPDRRPAIDPKTGLMPSFDGDVSDNRAYFTYDQPVIAVADGEIVEVVSDLDDAVPQVITAGQSFDALGGNRIVHRLAAGPDGTGTYAFYAHLKPGSPTVKVGERVTAGQEIARTGNSGNTTEAHLHFHVMDSPAPLDGNNLPFVLDELHLEGEFGEGGLTGHPVDRTDSLPLVNSVVTFRSLDA